MDYTVLTPENQAQMLTARLRQYEQQHYDATINQALLPGTADENPQRMAQLATQIADLAKSIATVKAMLGELPALTPAAAPPKHR